MPEGVEVKISSELIAPLVLGKTIKAAYSTANSRYGDSRQNGTRELGMDFGRFLDFDPDRPEDPHDNPPVKVFEVKVKGKFMFWGFDNGFYMMNTFGMSGQWSPTKGKHPCFVFEFTDGTAVYFNDPRHFGTVYFAWSPQPVMDKLNELGWDPLSEDISKWTSYLNTQIRKSNKPIGELLMNQKLFAGVGNYIRAEALYAAKISPWRMGNKLTISDLNSLYAALVNVMKDSYNHQGATIHTYTDAYGQEGKYSGSFKVYGQKSDPLGNAIIKEITPDKRSIHWCPTVQV